MFRNREDGALRLAEMIKGRAMRQPLVLAIPRGGVVTGAVLARKLGAELDVVLSRKIRSPMQPELAVGAISEDGRVSLSQFDGEIPELTDAYLTQETRFQLGEIARRIKMFRAVRPAANIVGRTVIVTDDGIATGSTMIAAVQSVRARHPHEIIVAVPVSSPDRLEEVKRWCDDAVCLLTPDYFMAVGQFYQDFSPVEDDEAVELLRQAQEDSPQIRPE